MKTKIVLEISQRHNVIHYPRNIAYQSSTILIKVELSYHTNHPSQEKLILNSVPKTSDIIYQNLDVNIESRSNIMSKGTSFNITTSMIYNYASFTMEILKHIKRKCALFINQSLAPKLHRVLSLILVNW